MITVVNTGVANISSVTYALDRIGVKSQVSGDGDVIAKSTHVIIPGVGTASAAIANLKAKGLDETLRTLTQPVLGICLGMQILYQHSEEGDVGCLGIFEGSVTKIKPAGLAIPHMGWNQVKLTRPSLLLKGIKDGSDFYYVHSFRAPLQSETAAVTEYGETIPAVLEFKNWFGAQFHPERSGVAGEQVLKNFLNL